MTWPNIYIDGISNDPARMTLGGYFTGAGLMPVRIRCPASTGIVTPVTLAARSEFR
jgi:hypothetical protein